jgi:hypothetical protein
MAEDALDVALLVAAAVERVGGEYFVGGSVASSLRGEPRAGERFSVKTAENTVLRKLLWYRAGGADGG